jgi:hypothetical protein
MKMKPFKIKYNPINIDEKQFTKWLITLWENKYPQTKGRLQDSQGYCCLGVACKELIPKSKLNMQSGYLKGGIPERQEYAPAWLLNIDSYLQVLTKGRAIDMNDIHNFTFPEIADVLYQVFVLGEYTTEGY